MSPIKQKQKKNHNKVHTQERQYDENTDPQHKSNEVAGKTKEIKTQWKKLNCVAEKFVYSRFALFNQQLMSNEVRFYNFFFLSFISCIRHSLRFGWFNSRSMLWAHALFFLNSIENFKVVTIKKRQNTHRVFMQFFIFVWINIEYLKQWAVWKCERNLVWANFMKRTKMWCK